MPSLPPTPKSRALALAGLLLVCLALALHPAWLQALWHSLSILFGPDDAPRRALVEHLGIWGPVLLIAGMLLQAIVPLLPAAADVVLTGLLYGFWGGLALVYTGTLLGAALGYWVGQRWGHSLIIRLTGPRLSQQFQELAQQKGVGAVLLVRLMPALKAEIMNLVAGAVGIPFWPFMAASAVGALPATALVIWLSGNPQRLMWGTVGVSALVGGLMLIRWGWHRYHQHGVVVPKQTPPSPD